MELDCDNKSRESEIRARDRARESLIGHMRQASPNTSLDINNKMIRSHFFAMLGVVLH